MLVSMLAESYYEAIRKDCIQQTLGSMTSSSNRGFFGCLPVIVWVFRFLRSTPDVFLVIGSAWLSTLKLQWLYLWCWFVSWIRNYHRGLRRNVREVSSDRRVKIFLLVFRTAMFHSRQCIWMVFLQSLNIHPICVNVVPIFKALPL